MTDLVAKAQFAPFSGGITTVTTWTMTVPPGTITDDVVAIVASIIQTASRPITYSVVNSSGGASAGVLTPTTGLSDTGLSTLSRGYGWTGTGFTAGDVITFTVTGGAGGFGCAAGSVYPKSTVEATGAAATSGTAMTVPSVTTLTDRATAVTFAVGVATTTRTVSNATGATLETSSVAGNNARWPVVAIADQIVTPAGPSAAVTINLSAAVSQSAGVQISLVAASGGGGTPPPTSSTKVRVAGSAKAAVRKVRAGGVAKTAVRKTRVGGVAH